MPELRVGERQWSVAAGSNLLDALNQNDVPVPYSCRAGSCHACLVQCVRGLPSDSRPDALSARQREQGWRLACQCQVVEDLQVHAFDPQTDGHPAEVAAIDWLSTTVLRLRVIPSDHCATAPVNTWCCGRAVWRGRILWPACRRKIVFWSFISIAANPGNSAMPPGNCASAIRSVSVNCAAVPCITTLTGTPGRCG